MTKPRTTFDVPGLVDRPKARGADLDSWYARREVMGPTYELRVSDQRQEGEPRHPHGVPEDLRPSLVEILAGAPRALPLSQRIEHGDEQSRGEAFDQGMQRVWDLASMHDHAGLGPIGLQPWIFHERRVSGRRYRPTHEGDEYPQQPYDTKGWQADVPQDRYRSF